MSIFLVIRMLAIPSPPPRAILGNQTCVEKRCGMCGPGPHLQHFAACKDWGDPKPRRRGGDPRHPSPSQKITDNIKGKVCSLAVCAVAWLVAHVRMLGLDEREKSLQMIRQLAGPLYSENTLQFYNERSAAPPRPLGTPRPSGHRGLS